MRTTVDLSDELFRRAKATAALRGCKFRDLVEQGLLLALETDTATQKPALAELMKDARGIIESGISDLATNPKHMKGFGRD
jgi:hypothetical protein